MARRSEPRIEMKSVGIWVRVSTEDQARGESPEHHEKRARLYAESKGWEVAEVYRLEAVSGKAVMRHSEAQRMLQDVRSGRITGLIFSKLARLARNTKELLEFSDIFRECGADLISLQESIDTSTPAGRLMYVVIGALAAWEREEIGSRIAASIPVRAKLGKTTGGAAPFGYQWKDGKLILDPKEAPVRKLIFDLFLESRRIRTVARTLNDRGYRTRDGSLFTYTAVRRHLTDPIAKGMRRANYTKTSDSKKAWSLKPEKDWVLYPVEPLVSEEVWEEANACLEDRKANRKPPAKRALHLFAGLAHCACGTKMYVTTSNPNRYVCQGCRNKIPITDLEALFEEQLRGFFASPEEIARHLKKADDELAEGERHLKALEAERRRVSADMDKLYDLYLSGEVPKTGFGRKYQPLAERLKQIEDELPRLQARHDVRKIGYLSSDQVVTEARDLYSRWKELSREERRRIVESVTERITVGKDEVSIDLLYLPPSPALPLNAGALATNRQGFIAATSCTRAG